MRTRRAPPPRLPRHTPPLGLRPRERRASTQRLREERPGPGAQTGPIGCPRRTARHPGQPQSGRQLGPGNATLTAPRPIAHRSAASHASGTLREPGACWAHVLHAHSLSPHTDGWSANHTLKTRHVSQKPAGEILKISSEQDSPSKNDLNRRSHEREQRCIQTQGTKEVTCQEKRTTQDRRSPRAST